MTLPPSELDLDEVHRAAFELRETNPNEAVRVLRRLAKKGGDLEPLVHGALGEILLDDFDDVDGAMHHFRRLLALAPGMAAGELGMARALVRYGDKPGAQEAYARALAGFEALAKAAQESTGEDAAEGADEAILTALELAIEERHLCEGSGRRPKTAPSAALLEWAESARLFDDPEDPGERGDWMRFARLRADLLALDGDLPAALAMVDHVGQVAPLEPPIRALLRSHLYETAGDFTHAADEALKAVADIHDPEETFRCAALLSEAKRVAEARQVLEQLRAHVAEDAQWSAEQRGELTEAIDSHLQELKSGGLVLLGRGRKAGHE